MANSDLSTVTPCFIRGQIERLLRRFVISYSRTGDTMEYFLTSLRTGHQVSYAIVFWHDRDTDCLHISKYFPELIRREDSKYLSAACFFLLVHHFSQHMASRTCRRISLKTKSQIFHAFYARLQDFQFKVWKDRGGDTVELRSDYAPRPMDTTMIIREAA